MGPHELIFSSQLLHVAHLNLITKYLKYLSHERPTFIFYYDELPVQSTVILGAGLGTSYFQVDGCGIVALAGMWSAAEAGELPVHDLPWVSGDDLVQRHIVPLTGHNIRNCFVKPSDVILTHPEEPDIRSSLC